MATFRQNNWFVKQNFWKVFSVEFGHHGFNTTIACNDLESMFVCFYLFQVRFRLNSSRSMWRYVAAMSHECHGRNLDLDPILREKMVTTGFPNWVMKDKVLSWWQKRIKTLQGGAAVC